MKKSWIILFCAAMALIACNKNNNAEEESDIPGKMSDLEYFQDGFVKLDENGNIVGYIIGENLNEADPSEVSVPVVDYDEARSLFLKWLPEGGQPAVNGKTYTWEMTDEEDKSEGQVIFAESTTPGVIATIRIQSQEAKVRTVKFIPETAWPENSSDMEEFLEKNYYLGALVQVTKDNGAGKGEFIVIREWTKQEDGIMIAMEGKKWEGFYDNPSPENNRDKCSSVNTTQTVSRVLHEGNNYEYIVNVYGKSKNWPSLDNRYLTTKQEKEYLPVMRTYPIAVNLETGEKMRINTFFKNPSYYKVYIYWFKPDGDKVQYW